jgi:ABC-type transport system involved in cytochrome bd biosynthesis fused ATPase/permease subunit
MISETVTSETKQGSAVLRRWSQKSRVLTNVGLGLQVISIVGWVCIAYGFGHAVGSAIGGDQNASFLWVAVFGVFIRTFGVWGAEELFSSAGQRITKAARC